MPQSTELAERVTHLETLFMHFERTIDDLGEVILAQQKAIEALAARVSVLEKSAPMSCKDLAPDDEMD